MQQNSLESVEILTCGHLSVLLGYGYLGVLTVYEAMVELENSRNYVLQLASMSL